MKALESLARVHDVTTIIVGSALEPAWSADTEWTRRVRSAGEELARRLNVPVGFVDERFTSVRAERAVRAAGLPRRERERRGRVDRAAAALILQTWLDRRPDESTVIRVDAAVRPIGNTSMRRNTAAGSQCCSPFRKAPRFREVTDTLIARDVIDHARLSSRAYVRLRRADRTLKAGIYRLPPGERWSEVLHALSQGRVATLPMTIPEGWRLTQMAPRIAEMTGLPSRLRSHPTLRAIPYTCAGACPVPVSRAICSQTRTASRRAALSTPWLKTMTDRYRRYWTRERRSSARACRPLRAGGRHTRFDRAGRSPPSRGNAHHRRRIT